jgi:hypothetical protein
MLSRKQFVVPQTLKELAFAEQKPSRYSGK